MKVLVTGAGALLGQGIIKSLRASSLSPQVVAVDPNPLAAGLYWGDSAHLVPMANDPEYLPVLRSILERERPAAVLIGTDVEPSILAHARHELESEYGVTIVVSSPEVVAVADDKWRTYEFLKANDFGHPRSCLAGGEDRLIEEAGFPLMVKPRVGARSIGCHVVHNRTELEQALQSLANPIVQEYVGAPEDEYTAGALTFGQKVASIVMRRELRDGNTYRAFSQEYPELNREVQRMALALGAFGPANFQFRLHQGRMRVFEINGRFSGTTPLRASAGFNEVEMTLRHLLFGEPLVQPAIRTMTILRHWSETIVEPGQSLF